MPSRPECHNCGAMTKMSGMCLIVHGFMIRQEMNYQLASAKRDNLVTPFHFLIPAVAFVAYLEPELGLIWLHNKRFNTLNGRKSPGCSHRLSERKVLEKKNQRHSKC